MLRLLLSRRWLGLLLVVAIVAVACAELGLWQFRRYAERRDGNAQITANLSASAAPVRSVMTPTTPPGADAEWRVVSMRGVYDSSHQFSVLYRTRDGAPGVEVVVPLRTASGAAVLVDRGWLSTPGGVDATTALPAPPAGQVTVTGWVRRNADDGSDQSTPVNGGVRSISSAGMATAVPYPLYDGFVEATHEQPSTTPHPAPALAPDLSAGPSFFYGMQWFFFALLAVGFWFYFAWAEYKQTQQPAPAAAGRSQRPGDAAVDGQHGSRDVAGRR